MPVTITVPDGEEQTFVKCAESSGAYVWLEKESLVVIEREDHSYETAFADTYVDLGGSRSPWSSEDDEPRTYGWDIDPERCDDYVQGLVEPDSVGEVREAVCGHLTVEEDGPGGVRVYDDDGLGGQEADLCEWCTAHIRDAGYVISFVCDEYVTVEKVE